MRLASCSCLGISDMKMLIFPHCSSFFIISVVSLQFLSCQGIYKHPSLSLSDCVLSGETDQGTWGSWSSWTRERSCQSGSCVGDDTQTSDKTCPDRKNNFGEKTFNFILFRKLSTLERLGSLSSQNSPLFTDPDQSVFRDLC